MSMRKKILFINILVTIAIALTGCWNAMELNALGITLVLGLDFENDKVIVTAEIIEPVPAKEKSVPSKGIPPEDTPKAKPDNKGVLGGVPSPGIPAEGTITIYKHINNNKQDAVVDNLVRYFGIKADIATKWVNEYGPAVVEEKIEVCRLMMEEEPKKIKNPPGLLLKALREDWDYPEWHYRRISQQLGK